MRTVMKSLHFSLLAGRFFGVLRNASEKGQSGAEILFDAIPFVHPKLAEKSAVLLSATEKMAEAGPVMTFLIVTQIGADFDFWKKKRKFTEDGTNFDLFEKYSEFVP